MAATLSGRINNGAPASSAGTRKPSATTLMLLAFLVLVVGGFALFGWREALAAVSKLSVVNILVLCALTGVHYVVRAGRWHMIVRASGVRTTLAQNARHFFGGFAMTATPGRVGELVRLRWLNLETGRPWGELLPIVLADRAVELGSIVLLIALALTATSLGTVAAWWLVGVAGALVWVACRPRLLELAFVTAWRLARGPWPRLAVRLRRVIRRLGPFMRPGLLVPVLTIGILGWACEGVAFWLLLTWLGAPIDLATATAIFLVAILSGALSGLPGGLGGVEASAVALLLLQGISPETAVVATAIIRVTTLWFAVLIGFALFPIAEMRAAAAR